MFGKNAWLGRALCAAVVCGCLASTATADVTTDAWDDSQGNVITGFWPSAVYSGSDIRDMFGGNFASIEPGKTIFPDAGWLPGNAVWVTWQTSSAIELSRFVLTVAADGDYPTSYHRAIRGFTLYTSDNGNDWNPIYDSGLLSAPLGTYDNGIYTYTCDHPFSSPISSQHFKMDFICDTTWGPRIVELDGYAAVPEPASLSLLALGGLALIRRRK